MSRFFAILFGIAFIFIGVLGFLPTYKTDDLLFGYLNTSYMHNMAYLFSGVIAIMSATRYYLAKWYFRVIGVVYLVVAIWGFWTGGDLYIMHVKLADNLIHLLIALAALLIGFGKRKQDKQ